MSPAGDAMKMIAKLTGSETKTTFNGGTLGMSFTNSTSKFLRIEKHANPRSEKRHTISRRNHKFRLLMARRDLRVMHDSNRLRRGRFEGVDKMSL